VASVTLDFVQPQEPDLVALRIYESTAQDGAYIERERVADIGTLPNYITRYTTDQAQSSTGWFAIAWENDHGVISPLSAGVKGNTDNYVAELVDRIMLRDPSISEAIAVEEAEAVLWLYLGEDPYSTEKILNPNELSGLTYLALGRIFTFSVAATSTVGDKYTAGIVSQGGGSSSTGGKGGASIKDLFDLGRGILGLNTSVIAQMTGIPAGSVAGACGCGYGYVALDAVTYDETRLLLDIDIP
jgi:hypothetical protein